MHKISQQYENQISFELILSYNIMSDFFRAIEVHIEDRCLLDSAEEAQMPSIATLGMDNIIYRREIESGAEQRFNLSEEITFDAFAMSPDGSHCLYGGKNKMVTQYNFADQSSVKLLETLGRVTSLRYSPGGRCIAVGSEEGKTTIYEPFSGRKDKCRPGHKSEVLALAWHKSLPFLASIGRDQALLIYKITANEQPQEVARFEVTKLQNYAYLGCSFHFTSGVLFTGGSQQLQKIENIENKWEHSKSSNISHRTELLLAEVAKPNTIVTSSAEEVVVWSIRQEEKLYVVEGFSISTAVAIAGRLFASCHDGKVYEYKREFKEEEPMEVQSEEESDRIEFEEQVEEEAEQQKEEERREYDYQRAKKTIAAKLITCEPQPALTQETQFFNDARFLQSSLLGCVTETQEGEERLLEVQFEVSAHTRAGRFQFQRSKNYSLFALNQLGLLYANQQEFGFRPVSESGLRGWESQWEEICAVAMGTGWVAIANDREIKILDMSSHELRSLAFDRQIVALRAYENLLAVVYHEGVPLYGSQQLAVQLYLVDSLRCSAGMIANVHLPLSRESRLKWVDYSAEGMLFSQDSAFTIRCLSLETNEWTTVAADSVEDSRKIWMLGVKNHQIYFWKTSDSDPEPTVSPRFNIKSSELSIPVLGAFPQGMQNTYEKLLWRRYALDHEKARARLWGAVRVSRSPSNLFYPLTASVLSEAQIADKHLELDELYTPLIQAYLKSKEVLRAFLLAQNCIRCQKSLEKIADLLDYENLRGDSIRLESVREERLKEIQYEQMQIFEFVKAREEAEKVVRPRSEDPMRRNPNRKAAQSLPSLSQSFMSQEVERSMEKPSVTMQGHPAPQGEETDNPFLKRKSNHQTLEARRKEISEQVEKFGIKQKADRKNISKPTM